MFERQDWTLFRELSKLGQKAGVPLQTLPKLVLKELVDNALDVAGLDGFEAGKLIPSNGFFVQDRGPGFDGDDATIAALFSINRPLASTKLLRLPTRGALGLRVVDGVPFEDQSLRWIAPNDRLMLKWVEDKRIDSDAGMRLRSESEQEGNTPSATVSKVVDGKMTDVSVKGMEPGSDIDPAYLAWLEEHKTYAGMKGTDITKIDKLVKSTNPDFNFASVKKPKPPKNDFVDAPDMTDEEWRKHIRGEIKRLCDRCDHVLIDADPSISYGRSYMEVYEAFRVGNMNQPSREKLIEILGWLKDSWAPYCEKIGKVA
jgi:hypothetical protein